MTDGKRTTGVDSLEAAKLASERGVRVYTVGIGTVSGETIGFEGWSMRVKLDEETLSLRLTVEKKETEIAGLLALIAAALAVASAGLSMLWFNRIL